MHPMNIGGTSVSRLVREVVNANFKKKVGNFSSSDCLTLIHSDPFLVCCMYLAMIIL